jgi:hypothetical protein
LVVRRYMAWKDATKSLGGKSAPKKGKKEIREIRTRKGKSGGYIHEHHFAGGDEPEEHTSPDQAGMLQHMMDNMGGGDPNAGNAAAAPTGPAAPAVAPAAAPGPPGAM